MKLLIVYGSTEGQTRKICNFLHTEAGKRNHEVVLNDSTANPVSPKDFDAAIIAASLHAGKYQQAVSHYVRKNHYALNRIPSAFISVSLTAASNEPKSWEELKQITRKFLGNTKWTPRITEQVAGALRYMEYNFFKRFIMRMIAQRQGGETDTSKDHEYTDWEQVKQVLVKLEKEVKNEMAKKTILDDEKTGHNS
ncbi:MAG TPA: menaquinone-dependent protoporphyrinogen IX dehydrogenase [Balneolaceae bacterium]|nr:menaquinone-dependent protoporphyrinogen IX dehydrogenase [Balneolaceae bacterium]